MNKHILGNAAAALLTGASLQAAELTEMFDKTFAGKATVGVENENGSVTVDSPSAVRSFSRTAPSWAAAAGRWS